MLNLAFRAERISPRITRIFAFSSERMYLVEGDTSAALLDTGSGIGFLRPFVERLTDKPVTVLVTHGHIDHAMGASEFPSDRVYINQRDGYIYREHCGYEFRKDGLFMIEGGGAGIDESDFAPIVPIQAYHDLTDGQRFDLGGISVEAYACPGHTLGSMVMLIPEERTLLLGDACNCNTFLFEDYSTSIETYERSLCRIREILRPRYDRALTSHGDGYAVPDIVEENIAICRDLMNGTTDAVPMTFRGHHGLIARRNVEPGHGNIVYNPLQIRDHSETIQERNERL